MVESVKAVRLESSGQSGVQERIYGGVREGSPVGVQWAVRCVGEDLWWEGEVTLLVDQWGEHLICKRYRRNALQIFIGELPTANTDRPRKYPLKQFFCLFMSLWV